MELYENIKRRRKSLKLSQDELAKLTGYTDRTSISKIESGKVDLPQSKIRLFAQALHTTEGELMGTTSNTEIEPDEIKLDKTYLRLAQGAQELGLDDDDVDAILAIYKKHKQKNS